MMNTKSLTFWFASVAMIMMTSCQDASSKIKPIEEREVIQAVTSTEVAEFKFDKTRHNFGEMIQGEKATTTFTFQNVGDAPLIISSATGSCGCTVPDYPKTPISPGATATIDVTFDSNGKLNAQEKTVNITANTVPRMTVLTINANVKQP